MLAPLILPICLTLLIHFVVIFLVSARSRRKRTFYVSVLASIILFIPSCFVVGLVVDSFRYGRFEFADTNSLSNSFNLNLPDTARNIIVFRHAGYYLAKFTVTTKELDDWIEHERTIMPDLNKNNADLITFDVAATEFERTKKELFDMRFKSAGWDYQPKMNRYSVALSHNGGGFNVWHLPGTETAYLERFFW